MRLVTWTNLLLDDLQNDYVFSPKKDFSLNEENLYKKHVVLFTGKSDQLLVA